jgi:hypothetical protein
LLSVDALALVLCAKVPFDALELDGDELVQLLVLIALVSSLLALGALAAERGAEFRQPRFELLDALRRGVR